MSIGLGLLFGSWSWPTHTVAAPLPVTDEIEAVHHRADHAGALLRAVERHPDLLPADDSDAAISAWADEQEHPPTEDDIEVIRDLLAKAGRQCRQVTEAPPAPRQPEITITPPPRGALEPKEAAKLFLDWLRVNGHLGPILADELSALYTSHCTELQIQPLFYATLRKELVKLPGVDRRIINISASSRDGKRQRPRVWYFGEPVAPVDSEAPWADLPQRAA